MPAAKKKVVIKKTAKKLLKTKAVKKAVAKKPKKVAKQKTSKVPRKSVTKKTTKRARPTARAVKNSQATEVVMMPDHAGPRLQSKASALEELFDRFQLPMQKIAYVSAFCFVAVGLTTLFSNSLTSNLPVAIDCEKSACAETLRNTKLATINEKDLSFQGAVPEVINDSTKVAVRSQYSSLSVELLNLTSGQIKPLQATKLSNENHQLIIEPDKIAAGSYVLRLQAVDETLAKVVYSSSFTVTPPPIVAGVSTSTMSTSSTILRTSSSSKSVVERGNGDKFLLNMPELPVLGRVVISTMIADELSTVELFTRQIGETNYSKLANMTQVDAVWFYDFDTRSMLPGDYEVVASYRSVDTMHTSESASLTVPKAVVLGSSNSITAVSSSSLFIPATVNYELALGATSSDFIASEQVNFLTADVFTDVTIDRLVPYIIIESDGVQRTQLLLFGSAPVNSYLAVYIAGKAESESVLVDETGQFFTVVEAELQTGPHDIVVAVYSESRDIIGISETITIKRKGDHFTLAGEQLDVQILDLSVEKFYNDIVRPLIRTILGIFVVFLGIILIFLSVFLRKKPEEESKPV